MANPTDTVLRYMEREMEIIQEQVERLGQEGASSEAESLQRSLNSMRQLGQTLSAEAAQKSAVPVVGRKAQSDQPPPPRAQPYGDFPTAPDNAVPQQLERVTAGSTFKAAALAGAKVGIAGATSKGLVKIAITAFGDKLPPMLTGPTGEAALSLLLPALINFACDNYGDMIPHSAQLREVAALAIQGTSQELMEQAISGVLPVLTQLALMAPSMSKMGGLLGGVTDDRPSNTGPIVDTTATIVE